MAESLIKVCVQLEPGADSQAIQRAVLGRRGKLGHQSPPNRFWASTSLTIRQVRNLQGVKNCTLAERG